MPCILLVLNQAFFVGALGVDIFLSLESELRTSLRTNSKTGSGVAMFRLPAH